MKTISLINMKGGVCKTTLAVNIADCLVQRNEARVLLVDVDPQFNATQCLMAPDDYVMHLKEAGDTVLSIFDRTRTVASTVGKAKESKPKKLESITVVTVKEGFDLLPGNLELYRLEMAPGGGHENRLKHFLEKHETDYDYVIIDTPPTPSVWMTSALIASDYYVIPVRADPISMTGIDLLRNIIDEKAENFDLELECAGLVLTVVEQHTNVYKSAAGTLSKDKYWSNYLYPMHLPKRVHIATEQLNQTLILDGNNTDSKRALTAITKELVKRVNTA